MFPLAPVRLSGTTVMPHASDSTFATMRPIVSVAPPGGYERISRSGLVGYVCAKAGALAAQTKKHSKANRNDLDIPFLHQLSNSGHVEPFEPHFFQREPELP